jgi:hypothetical protein
MSNPNDNSKLLINKLMELHEISSEAIYAMTNDSSCNSELVSRILNLQKETIQCIALGLNKYAQKDRRAWAQLQRLYNETELNGILTSCNIQRAPEDDQ